MTSVTNRPRSYNQLHTHFHSEMSKTARTTTLAAFLAIGGLVVLFCSSLCLKLDGINVMRQVILPAMVPGAIALLLSLPLAACGIRLHRQQSSAWSTLVNFMQTELERDGVLKMEKREAKHYLRTNFFYERENTIHYIRLIDALKSQNKENKELKEALDALLKKIYRGKI